MSILRNRHFLLIDLALIPVAAAGAFALRLDAAGMSAFVPAVLLFIAVALPVKPIIFRWFGLYGRFWRYASVDDLLTIVAATAASTLAVGALVLGLAAPLSGIIVPRSIPFIDGLLTLCLVGGTRFVVRLAEQRRQHEQRLRQTKIKKRVLIVGAGDAGAMIVKEMHANPQLGLIPVGFVDDDEHKQGMRIHGRPVLGNREQLPRLVRAHRVDEVIIAIPTAPGSAIRAILTACHQANVPARTIPGLYDILSGQVSVNQIRQVDIEDLLRREPVRTDTSAIGGMLRGRRVLVTGAGGSIGSELCRQIALSEPSHLILLGHGEHSIFGIANELRRRWPALPVTPAIADVRDADRLRCVFAEQQPEIVFHAAAHKHVPLMEQSAAEAVTNNVQGTAYLLHHCEAHHAARFVLISTDKAVNPTSVMGATKRVAELLVQETARRSQRPYVTVRFGNVLGSRGSVVPIFRDQIARGGPITITHPEVRRYFMTIPEAVQLVLQAAVLGQGGEVFLLDMGNPIPIVDLARDLVTLSGLQVGEDIEIVYTGLRPGEKLYEELFIAGEEYTPTPHDKVFISRNGAQARACPVNVAPAVRELIALAQQGSERQVRAKLCEIVPEYRPASDAG
ncbi:MAG: polysaccharide biosynthesis protein [Chloroflexi bacterium]|nr:polysaccharide biosynthesis protein [Chloroflexota bacterium]